MYVVGTAGHVDHGKSALIEALTGIDPVRLQEEKDRGMTIDLGFAWMRLPSDTEISIVDVPGHEKFVNNMLAGVAGIDLVLLVVAADESVMPQTREHLAILNLLKVKRGVIVVTKADLVDSDWIDLVVADIEEILSTTILSESPIVPVSSITGDGLNQLTSVMDDLLKITEPKRDVGRPRLPIDRSFTMPGFGTVVTGTLIDGTLNVGQDVQFSMSGQTTRIRGLQTHRSKLNQALPGSRVAVNLSGVSHREIKRGEVLTTPNWLSPTTAIDVELNIIPDAPRQVRHNMFVTVHSGSNEVIGRVRLLEKQIAEPGNTTWAQLKLVSPLAVVKGDRFVIRSNQITLGGGNIVDSHARRHRRMHLPTLERLKVMGKGSDKDILLKAIEISEPREFHELVNQVNFQSDMARIALESMAHDGLIITLGQLHKEPDALLYSMPEWTLMTEKIRDNLETYHHQFPLRNGTPKEELRSKLRMKLSIFNRVFPRLKNDGVLLEEKAQVRLPQHHPKLSKIQEKEVDSYMELLDIDPYSPSTSLSIDQEILNFLADQGKIAKVSETVVFSATAYQEMVDKIVLYIKDHQEITVANVRDLFGTSRKYAMALMNHLDQEKITRRVGDARILR